MTSPFRLASLAGSRLARLVLVAASLAATFTAVTHSSSDPEAVLEDSLRRGADRLVATQGPDGLWAPSPGLRGDVRSAGRMARSLVLAWQVTRDPRHLVAAKRTAQAIGTDVREGRAASSCNLLLLADVGTICGQPSLVETARAAWLRRFQSTLPADGAEAARQLLATPPARGVEVGSWRNYLLGRAAEEADVARSLGHDAWADAFLLEAAGTWSPKHDHESWASAAGTLLGALSRAGRPEARRLELAQSGLLESNSVFEGVAWNDTPYDDYVYASETALALTGRVRAGAGADALAGLQFLAARQAPHGGWGALLSLVDEVAAHGDQEMRPAADAAEESAVTNAQVVEALALGLGARG